MLVQDTLTGYLHEVPDSQAYGAYLGELPDPMGEVAYDGFGNPVGLSFLAPLAAKFAPTALKALPGIFRGARRAIRRFVPVARAFQRALPGAIQQFVPAVRAFQQALPAAVQQFAPAAQAFQQAAPGAMQQFAPAAQAFQPAVPGAMEQPMPGPGEEAEFAEVPYPIQTTPFRRPPPPGWIPRPHPYTGLRPRPVYMRCLVWRGPRGLVPARAAQTPPAAIAPSAAVALQQARGIRRRARRIGGRRR
jgi:hypothetical protein